jgi:hypothetical protein
MRIILLFLVLLTSFSNIAKSDDISSEDLARHFQITTWATTLNLSPGNYDVSLFEIIDGKLSEKSLAAIDDISPSSVGSLTDSVRVVLMVSDTTQSELADHGKQMDAEHKMRYSFFVGDCGLWRYTHKIPLTHKVQLPKGIGEGDYVLGGQPAGINLPSFQQPTPFDFKSGIVLRIIKRKNANKARQGTAGRSPVCFMAFPPAVPAR